MKGSDLNEKAIQTLRDFESLGELRPSDGWDEAVVNRLRSTRPRPRQSLPVTGMTWVLLVFILANVGIILSAITGLGRRSNDRSVDLKAISTEFLVNPTLISE